MPVFKIVIQERGHLVVVAEAGSLAEGLNKMSLLSRPNACLVLDDGTFNTGALSPEDVMRHAIRLDGMPWGEDGPH